VEQPQRQTRSRFPTSGIHADIVPGDEGIISLASLDRKRGGFPAGARVAESQGTILEYSLATHRSRSLTCR